MVTVVENENSLLVTIKSEAFLRQLNIVLRAEGIMVRVYRELNDNPQKWGDATVFLESAEARSAGEMLIRLADKMEKPKEGGHDCSSCKYDHPHGCNLSGGEPCDPPEGKYPRWKPKEGASP